MRRSKDRAVRAGAVGAIKPPPAVAPEARVPRKANSFGATTGRGFMLLVFCAVALPMTFALGGIGRADDWAAQQRRQIENMTPAEKEKLRRWHEWFANQEKQEQSRLRELHRRLQEDPQAERLRRVMHGYCRWLKELPPYRRAELLGLEPAERVERIKKLREAEAQKEDIEALFKWMEQYAAENQQKILESMPEPRRQQMDEMDPEALRRWTMGSVWLRLQWVRPGGRPTMLTDEDLTDLRSHLSDETRKRLEQQPPDRQWQIVADWVRHAARERFGSRRSPDGPFPPDFQAKLDHFFEHELPEEDRYRLLGMSGEEMQRELRRMYLIKSGLSGRPPYRGPGPPRGGGRRPGPPNGHRDPSREDRHGPPGPRPERGPGPEPPPPPHPE